MDNKAIAGILYETADLLEIDGAGFVPHPFLPQRRRSHRSPAATDRRSDCRTKQVLAIPGIGKGMLANLQEMFKEGGWRCMPSCCKKYRPSMLELLKIQGLGPKTIALIWSAYQVMRSRGRGEAGARRQDPRRCRAWAKSTSRSC